MWKTGNTDFINTLMHNIINGGQKISILKRKIMIVSTYALVPIERYNLYKYNDHNFYVFVYDKKKHIRISY